MLAPIITRTKPVDERDHHELVKVLRGFIVVHVFDISQTDGADLANVTPTLLTCDAPSVTWDKLATHITNTGFTLERGDCDGANGFSNHTTRARTLRHRRRPSRQNPSPTNWGFPPDCGIHDAPRLPPTN